MRDQRDQVGILPQQREQPAGAMQSRQEAVEGEQRRVRIRGAGEMGQQQRHQLRELARAHARRAASGSRPTSQCRTRAETSSGCLKPMAVSLSRVSRSSASAGNDERAGARLGRRRALEQGRVVALHVAQMAEQRLGKAVAIGKAEEAGEAFEPLAVARQRVGLLVGDHLQPVLEHAQEPIGGAELVARRGADPFALGQHVEHRQRLAAAQLRMAAAGDELLGLHEELDLADAAAAELDVVALDRDLAMAAIGVDLPLHAVDVGDGGEVEIFAPDERRQLAQQLLAGRDVAGAGARLDHGGALPVAPDALVVVERRRGRDRDLGRARVGPQPQIGAEHVAVGGALLQQLHQAARDAARRTAPARCRARSAGASAS